MTRFNIATRLAFGALISLAGELGAQPTPPRQDASHAAASIREFTDRLSSPDPRERAEAACQLSRRHADAASAIPILLSMLSDDVTVSGVKCRLENRPGHAAPESVEARKQLETSPAQEAANALGDIGDAAVPGLLKALEHSDWKTRRLAAVGLGEVDSIIDRPPVVGALIHRLTDGHPDVRERSAWALGEIEDPAAVEPLLTALTDSESRVRARAAWALGEIEDRAALTGLTRALKDTAPGVRGKAAWALGEVDDPGALGALREALMDTDREVHRSVVHAMGKLRERAEASHLRFPRWNRKEKRGDR